MKKDLTPENYSQYSVKAENPSPFVLGKSYNQRFWPLEIVESGTSMASSGDGMPEHNIWCYSYSDGLTHFTLFSNAILRQSLSPVTRRALSKAASEMK